MKQSSALRRIWILAAVGGMLGTLVLVGAPRARPAAPPPLLTLQPVTVANGTAIVAGNVNGAGAGAQLTVNGTPLGIDASGNFTGIVNLAGASAIDLALASPTTGNTNVAFQIPVTGSIIPGNVLDTVEQALSGLQITNGPPVTVSGSVLNGGDLAGLSVNGKDVLGSLGADHLLSFQVPGSSKEVTVTATDKSGVSETTSSSISTRELQARTQAIAAKDAIGLRIASVRYYVRHIAQTKRVRMVVTIKDRRGYLVRGAKITVRAAQSGRLIRRAQTKPTGRLGQAGFLLRLRPSAFGKRLVMVTVGKTPSAKASKKTSVKVPKLKR